MGARRLAFETSLEPFELLAIRSRRLANAVGAISRRADVVRLRSKLVLLLLRASCPLASTPRRPWYVPGGVARLGARGIMHLWRQWWAEPPPTLRTVRSHLGELERGCILVRAPGDWCPVKRNPAHPERRPRYPDTFHLLEEDQAATWWAEVGHPILDHNPEARWNPGRWQLLFGTWRRRATSRQGELFAEELAGVVEVPRRTDRVAPSVRSLRTAEAIADVITPGFSVFEILYLHRDHCARVHGGNTMRLAMDPDGLRGAAAMLAIALRRGDRVRNRAAWLVRAWKHAPREEKARAVVTLTRVFARRSSAHGKRERSRQLRLFDRSLS